ncbi:hypothetical protein B0T13DRAFT_259964 [Neurospora crassa]|nr:hypothetical protein B0T13DRAFT_259964 [Neurospora crassa]
MRLTQAIMLLAAGAAQAASSWGFDDASISVAAKKGSDAIKEKFSQKAPLTKPVGLGSTDAVKIILTAKEDGKAKRPHQAFVTIQEQETGLEAPFPLTVKDTGKAVVQISQKDLPVQFLLSPKPLKASVIIGSFGEARAVNTPVFDIEIQTDPNTPLPKYEAPIRYGKKPEIHHIFRPDPQSPPKVISLFFALAVAATVPALFISVSCYIHYPPVNTCSVVVNANNFFFLRQWLLLGANLNHLSKALGAAPLSHITFFGSIVAMEGVFFLYYTSWNLFQILPVAGVVGIVTVLSGTKALGEVQSRRLAGER